MRKYRKKFVWQKISYSNLVIIILGILIFLVARGIFNLYRKYNYTKQDYQFVESQQVKAQDSLVDNQVKLKMLY